VTGQMFSLTVIRALLNHRPPRGHLMDRKRQARQQNCLLAVLQARWSLWPQQNNISIHI